MAELNKIVIEALGRLLLAGNKTKGGLLKESLGSHILNPFAELMPTKELTEDEVKNFLNKYVQKGFDPLKADVKLWPLTMALSVGMRFMVMFPFLFQYIGMWGEKHMLQPGRKFFRPTLLDKDALYEGWRRDKKLTAHKDETLKRIGFKDEDIKILDKIAWFIPGARDVIAFAVREVYSPEIARKFGQFEELDKVWDAAKGDIEAAGMDKPTFTKFWAAHWVLPSIMQGFEMLHRGEINSEELDRLFVALDVMPFWREKLKAISFAPFTRVDVRRMHKVGVITSTEELIRAYKDVGYNDEKAAKLAEFTLLYNAEPEANEETFADREAKKNRDLTKSDILKAYRTGLIEEREVKQALLGFGYSSDEVDFYLGRENYLIDEDKAERFIKLLREAYLNGVVDRSKVTTKLGELNLPARYTANLMEAWDLELAIKAKTPSKAEMLRFYEKGIVQEFAVRAELSRMGYEDKYIKWYLEDSKPKEKKT